MLDTWYAAYCEGKRELYARDNLRERGFEVFLPFERTTRRRKLMRRNAFVVETVDIPVFPNYIFVRSQSFLEIERTWGVISVVASNGRPLPIPERVIATMKSAADADGMVAARDLTRLSLSFGGRIGDQFFFKRASPFAGLIGKIASLTRLDDTGLIEVVVQMLGGERLVRVPHTVVGLTASRIATSVVAQAAY